MVEAAIPSATTGDVPKILVKLLATGPAMKLTVPPILLRGDVMLRVFVSAFREVMVHV